jgi:chromosome partitioning protein
MERTGARCYWVEDDLCSACKTTVVSLASIKGGNGKTNIAALLAKAYAAAGKNVGLIDFDLNNSLSFHSIEDDDEMEKTKRLNIATALSDEKNNLCDFFVPTRTKGVNIIASTPYLADLRTLNEKRLKRMIPTLYGKYDICIIDCPPTYDNIVLNAVNASDFTITPVLKDLFSYNAATFFSGVLPRDVEGFKNWFLLINGYDKRYEEAKSGRQYDFINLYQNGEFKLTPPETWLPWTTMIHLIIDYHKNLTCTKGIPNAVYNPDLYKAVKELAGCFFDYELDIPEVF